MRIVIDLDGTICEVRQENQSYESLLPLPGAVQKITELRSRGHYVIIATARNMQTCESNLGLVMKNIGKITLDWLAKHGIQYDEIYFGKPNADIYIDDRACRFSIWDLINDDMLIGLGKPK
jgi:capsule biosynthesis phosphatase